VVQTASLHAPGWCNPTHPVHAVGLVVAHDEPIFAFHVRHEEMSKAWIAIVEDAGMPRPRHALEDGREAGIAIRAAGRPALALASTRFRSDHGTAGNFRNAPRLRPSLKPNVSRTGVSR